MIQFDLTSSKIIENENEELKLQILNLTEYKITLLKENNKLKSMILSIISKMNSVECQKIIEDKEFIVSFF